MTALRSWAGGPVSSGHEATGPYGCLCPTLAIKLNGDGCDMCQPQGREDERRQGERRKSAYQPHEEWFLADAPDRRTGTDRRQGVEK